MNKKLDLVKILKDCPSGTKLYSMIRGVVYFSRIDKDIIADDDSYIIIVNYNNDVSYKTEIYFQDGTFIKGCGECVLFPSKEQRDWNKFKMPIKRFDVNEFKPFDKILTKKYSDTEWQANLFSCQSFESIKTIGNQTVWKYAIPYNEETSHLVNTLNDCPEYYKWWKDK